MASYATEYKKALALIHEGEKRLRELKKSRLDELSRCQQTLLVARSIVTAGSRTLAMNPGTSAEEADDLLHNWIDSELDAIRDEVSAIEDEELRHG